VQRLAKQQASEMVPSGTAIRTLLDRAVGDVERLARASGDRPLEWVAIFLQLWYRERQTVVRAAEALGLSRTHVAREVQRQALTPPIVGFPSPAMCAPAQPNVRGVAGNKLSQRKTFAVMRGSMDASTYLGASAPSSFGGHPARSSA
jgi:hypothetical protein